MCRLAIVAVDVQLFLGLCLYAVSPLVRAAWANMAGAMEQHELRFFSVEHLTVMILAVAAAHVGSWRAPPQGGAPVGLRFIKGGGWRAFGCVLIGVPWWRPFLRALNLG